MSRSPLSIIPPWSARRHTRPRRRPSRSSRAGPDPPGTCSPSAHGETEARQDDDDDDEQEQQEEEVPRRPAHAHAHSPPPGGGGGAGGGEGWLRFLCLLGQCSGRAIRSRALRQPGRILVSQVDRPASQAAALGGTCSVPLIWCLPARQDRPRLSFSPHHGGRLCASRAPKASS